MVLSARTGETNPRRCFKKVKKEIEADAGEEDDDDDDEEKDDVETIDDEDKEEKRRRRTRERNKGLRKEKIEK